MGLGLSQVLLQGSQTLLTNINFLSPGSQVQGVKEALLRGPTCPCVSEDDLKAGLPAGTSCQEFWPKKNFLSKVSSRKSSRLGSWTRLVLSWGGGSRGG